MALDTKTKKLSAVFEISNAEAEHQLLILEKGTSLLKRFSFDNIKKWILGDREIGTETEGAILTNNSGQCLTGMSIGGEVAHKLAENPSMRHMKLGMFHEDQGNLYEIPIDNQIADLGMHNYKLVFQSVNENPIGISAGAIVSAINEGAAIKIAIHGIDVQVFSVDTPGDATTDAILAMINPAKIAIIGQRDTKTLSEIRIEMQDSSVTCLIFVSCRLATIAETESNLDFWQKK